jgi:hypothetical protein
MGEKNVDAGVGGLSLPNEYVGGAGHLKVLDSEITRGTGALHRFILFFIPEWRMAPCGTEYRRKRC